jgi:hypothetical protein
VEKRSTQEYACPVLLLANHAMEEQQTVLNVMRASTRWWMVCAREGLLLK